MNSPVLSVCLITYNHENYIRQAIESVLAQQVDFEWELIIADDFSTDGTRAIIEEYHKGCPDFIRVILQRKNVGPAKNWLDLITAPKSRYIAYLEGDDYWTDEFKLQKQVDFLESNPNFVLCHSDVHMIDTKGNPIKDNLLKSWNKKNANLDYRFAIFSPLAFSCTAVFRNILPIKKLSLKVMAGDWMLWVLLTLRGEAKYLDEKLAAYRSGSGVSQTSVWHRDFHHRAFFLLKQLSIVNSWRKNSWLFKGFLYFLFMQSFKIFKIEIFSQIAKKLKYSV